MFYFRFCCCIFNYFEKKFHEFSVFFLRKYSVLRGTMTHNDDHDGGGDNNEDAVAMLDDCGLKWCAYMSNLRFILFVIAYDRGSIKQLNALAYFFQQCFFFAFFIEFKLACLCGVCVDVCKCQNCFLWSVSECKLHALFFSFWILFRYFGICHRLKFSFSFVCL